MHYQGKRWRVKGREEASVYGEENGENRLTVAHEVVAVPTDSTDYGTTQLCNSQMSTSLQFHAVRGRLMSTEKLIYKSEKKNITNTE
jgi:hypothetical protein